LRGKNAWMAFTQNDQYFNSHGGHCPKFDKKSPKTAKNCQNTQKTGFYMEGIEGMEGTLNRL